MVRRARVNKHGIFLPLLGGGEQEMDFPIIRINVQAFDVP